MVEEDNNVDLKLTSTTAPGITFRTRIELANHYKSAWHKYNLKRREAGLPVLLQSDFNARLAAAQAVRNESSSNKNKKGGGSTTTKSGTDHLKQGKKHKKKKKNGNNEASSVMHVSQVPAYDRMKEEEQMKEDVVKEQSEVNVQNDVQEKPDVKDKQDDEHAENDDDDDNDDDEKVLNDDNDIEEKVVEIDPCQSLFDNTYVGKTVQENVQYMLKKYGFFIPDQEYLIDIEGLIGYCHEKIKLGKICLYCQKTFHKYYDVQKHMIASNHTKIKYEPDIDMDEYDVFYDFSKANQEFLNVLNNNNNKNINNEKDINDQNDNNNESAENDGNNDDDDDDEWEDIPDDEFDQADQKDTAGNDDDDDDEMYKGYEEEVQRMGFTITPLGELVFPDGRIIGHRSLQRYYKQRARTNNNSNTVAVQAARLAAGERLFRGRVYQIGNGVNDSNSNNTSDIQHKRAIALTQAGIAPGLATGRAGKGILVTTNNNTYSQISIYRYRAAIRKQHRDELYGKRIYEKTKQNINRMDKKHNRLMNGVSVAHAAR